MARMTSSVLLAAISRYAVIRRVLGLHRVGSVADATAARSLHQTSCFRARGREARRGAGPSVRRPEGDRREGCGGHQREGEAPARPEERHGEAVQDRPHDEGQDCSSSRATDATSALATQRVRLERVRSRAA
jgi:hypothetical protein